MQYFTMKVPRYFYQQTEPQADRRAKKTSEDHRKRVHGLSKACRDLKCHKCTSLSCEHDCHDDEK